MFVKVKLKLFIGEVDAELFKAVMLVIFKSKNVQNSYRASLKSQKEVVLLRWPNTVFKSLCLIHHYF